MARRRKESAADAAYKKELKGFVKAAKEQERFLQAAEGQTRFIQAVEGQTRFIQEMEEQERFAQAAAEAERSAQETQQAQDELQKLMQLPLSQIEELPQVKRVRVWEGLARQIVEAPELINTVTAITATTQKAMEAAARFAEWATSPADELPIFKFANWTIAEAEKAALTIKNASEGIKDLLSDDTREAFQTGAMLVPYMEAEVAENPELYDNPETPATTLIAAAARRARADGKEIPPLKAEAEPEQMQKQLDLPTEPDKEGNPTEAAAVDDKKQARRNHIEDARKRHEIAKQEGALIAQADHLAIIADKRLGFDYFTSVVCKLLPADTKNYMLDEQGRINLYDLTGSDKSIEDVLQEVDGVHTAFLMLLLALALKNSDIRETNSGNAIIPVYLPTVLEKMRIDPRPLEWDNQSKKLKKAKTNASLADLRLNKFMSFLSPLNRVAAWFDGDLYAIAGFDHYNRESETVYIRTPYMFRLVEYAKLRATKHGAISNVFHADIMTENQTAVEIANRIAMGLIQRGVTTPDSSTYLTPQKPIKKKTTRTAADGTKTVEELTFAPETETTITKSRTDENGITTTVTGTPQKKEKTFTFEIRFSSLIADCPQLQRELDEIKKGTGQKEAEAVKEGKTEEERKAARRADHANDSQRTNKKLKDTFTAAIRIIMEKSEIPKYYKGLTIRTGRFDTFKAPTNSTVTSDKLIIAHHGKNPDFSK